MAHGGSTPTRVRIEPELVEICNRIENMDLSLEEWAERDSFDMFQSETFCGGFDACDMVFTFGRYENGDEIYCVQISLEQVPLITKSIMRSIEVVRFD